MKKIHFNIDDLKVQSFDTTEDARVLPRGTVFAQTEVPYENTSYNDPACNPLYTQNSSCAHGGGETCDGCASAYCTLPSSGCQGDTSNCGNTQSGNPCATGYCGSTQYCTGNTCGSTCPAAC